MIVSVTTQDLHVNALQRYSQAALSDGLDLPTIRDLASLACWGKHASNVERDLHRMIPSLYGSCFPTHYVGIDVYNPDTATIQEQKLPILLASDVLHQLWKKNSPQLWEIVIGCTAERAHAFWTTFGSNDQSSRLHPVIQRIGGIR